MRNRIYNKKKIFVVFAIAMLMLVALLCRLSYLMLGEADYFQKKATGLHEREREIKAARGQIVDANGVILAENETVCTISVIHSQIKEPIKVIQLLSELLEMDPEKIGE